MAMLNIMAAKINEVALISKEHQMDAAKLVRYAIPQVNSCFDFVVL
jgi:hypothetical protein